MKKRNRKDIAIAVLVIFSIILSIYSISATHRNNVSPKDHPQSAVASEEDSTGKKSTVESSDSTVTVSVDKEEYATKEEIRDILDEGFKDNFNVSYNYGGNAYYLMAGSEDMAEDIFLTMTGGVSNASWNELVSALQDLSESASEATGDYELKMIVVNPFSPEKSLLTVENGTILNNAMSE